MPSRLRTALPTLLFTLPASAAFAQETAATGTWDRLLYGIAGTVVFGLIGILLAIVGMKAFEWVMPFSVRKELEEDHNTAVAIVMGAMVLGVSVIIAATILS